MTATSEAPARNPISAPAPKILAVRLQSGGIEKSLQVIG
jgi:hypothetical protein